MPRLSLSEVRRLKNQVEKLSNKSEKGLKEVPSTWNQFAPLTSIRSGAGFVKFNPYSYQSKLVDLVTKQFTTVIVKTRQLGISETLINYFIFQCLLTPGTNCVVLSMNQQATSNLAKRCRLMIESLVGYASLETDSLQVLSFTNGSTIFFRNATINGSRGLESVKYILIDEAEFILDIGEIYKAVLPCTSMLGSDARIIINSTPGMRSGFYFDKLMSNNGDKDIIQISEDIKQGKQSSEFFVDDVGWGKAIIHWREHPIFSKTKDYLSGVKERFQLDDSTVQREYNLSFQDSAEAVFSPAIISAACEGKMVKTARDKGEYYIGIDPSAAGKDYFVATVLEWKDGKLTLVELYRKRKETTQVHQYNLGKLFEKYKPELVSIEVNSIGQPLLEQLTLDNPKVAFEAVKTTASSKPTMIGRLLMILEDNSLKLSEDDIIVQELLSFQRKDNKYAAVEGKTDDIVMSLAINLVNCPWTLGSVDFLTPTIGDDNIEERKERLLNVASIF